MGCAAALAARHRAGLDRSRSSVDDDALGDRACGAGPARRCGRRASRSRDPVTLPAPPTPLPDLAPVASRRRPPARPRSCCCSRHRATTTGLAQQLAALGFTGTVAVDDAFYQPATPAIANGLTVLVPYAPFEQTTPANRRLAADVEAFAPGTDAHAGGRRRVLVGRPLPADARRRSGEGSPRALPRGRERSDFSYAVPGTVGRSTWPAMHTQGVPCGALVQSDGTRYLVAEPYRCGDPIVRAPTTTKKTTQ